MQWSSPNTVIPSLPAGLNYHGVSPQNVPIPLTPSGQPMQMQMYPQQQQQQGYYLQAQPQMQMPMYGQAYQPVQAAPFAQAYPQPGYGQSPYMMPGQAGVYPGQARERARAREDNPPLDKWMDGSICKCSLCRNLRHSPKRLRWSGSGCYNCHHTGSQAADQSYSTSPLGARG